MAAAEAKLRHIELNMLLLTGYAPDPVVLNTETAYPRTREMINKLVSAETSDEIRSAREHIKNHYDNVLYRMLQQMPLRICHSILTPAEHRAISQTRSTSYLSVLPRDMQALIQEQFITRHAQRSGDTYDIQSLLFGRSCVHKDYPSYVQVQLTTTLGWAHQPIVTFGWTNQPRGQLNDPQFYLGGPNTAPAVHIRKFYNSDHCVLDHVQVSSTCDVYMAGVQEQSGHLSLAAQQLIADMLDAAMAQMGVH